MARLLCLLLYLVLWVNRPLIMRVVSSLFMTVVLCCVGGVAALAACTSPAASAGTIEYNTAGSNYRYCNGTSWVSMAGSVQTTNCSSAAQMYYDSTVHRLIYCNGTKLVYINTTGTTETACTSPTATAGSMEYNTSTNKFQVCAGGWQNSP